MKNQDILNDDALHFKLARSVLKIASFKFANFNILTLKNALEASFECEMRNSHVHVSDCFVMNKI